jgi:hypothetical protein
MDTGDLSRNRSFQKDPRTFATIDQPAEWPVSPELKGSVHSANGTMRSVLQIN